MKVHKGEGTEPPGNKKDRLFSCGTQDYSDNGRFAFKVQLNFSSSHLEQTLCRVIEKAPFHLQH